MFRLFLIRIFFIILVISSLRENKQKNSRPIRKSKRIGETAEE